VLTVDFEQFPIAPGERVLDLGCGGGRHAFELYRRGAEVVACDYSLDELRQVATMFYAMSSSGEVPSTASAKVVRGDIASLPFPDASFDAVIVAEVLEHIPDDERAMGEIARILKPGGRLAVTVPRWWPEQLNWALPGEYQHVPGGHIRIYRGDQLKQRLTEAGVVPRAQHHAHALHSPYWWLNCTFGRESLPSRLYNKMLVWDIMSAPWITRTAEKLLNPVMGKSLVVYADKPADAGSNSAAA
jgi:SAM-dependent methyltransferase